MGMSWLLDNRGEFKPRLAEYRVPTQIKEEVIAVINPQVTLVKEGQPGPLTTPIIVCWQRSWLRCRHCVEISCPGKERR